MDSKAFTPIFTEQQIADRVRALGAEITAAYRDSEIVTVVNLSGAYVFFADLVREIHVPVVPLFLQAVSYPKSGGTSGEVRLLLDAGASLEGKHVLFIEGTVVSGRTPKYLLDVLALRRPASLRFCSLVVKPASLAVDIPLDFVGFRTDDTLHGYGMSPDGPAFRHRRDLGTVS